MIIYHKVCQGFRCQVIDARDATIVGCPGALVVNRGSAQSAKALGGTPRSGTLSAGPSGLASVEGGRRDSRRNVTV
jgi:hypothetical protein